MPHRQKYLLIGLAAAVLLWQGGAWGNRLILEPLRELRGQVHAKSDVVSNKRSQMVAIEQAKTKLRNWQARSLPPDPGKKTRPDAVEAQRQYTAWLTELVHSGSFDEVSVTPQRRSVSRNNVYVEVVVQIDGEGRFSQLAELLDRFYRTNLLHRIGRIQIASQDVFGDPPVKFSLEAQALALADVPPRRTIFPQTTLKEDASADAKQLRVASANGFPKKTPFRIRMERELLTVTHIAGDDEWSVDRGVERTQPSDHAAKSKVELNPINGAAKEFTAEEFREFVRTNPFVKPTPPVDYEPTFGPFSPPVAVRGKSWQYSIAAKDYDPARGEPKYQLQGESPAGLTLHETTGQLTWKPDAGPPAGEFTVGVVALHPSAPGGRLQEELTLKLVEPNTAPKFSAVRPATVYRGQPWKITVEASDPDEPAQKLSYKLGDAPGMQINAETGEVTWTPGEDQPLGPVNFTVSVTDSGTPPQTATTSVTANVVEDAAQQTFLFGIVRVDDVPQALFSDKSQNNRKLTLRVGDELRAADIAATIEDISDVAIIVQRGASRYRMKLGDSIRSLDKATPITPAGSAETPN